MPTESEIKIARYQKVEKEPDGLGRVIGVRRLKPSEQTRVAGYCADLTGYDEDPVPFPRNRAELDSIYDRLDQEGVAAAGAAVARLADVDLPNGAAAEAKN
jgi:hypothetical protein